MHQRDFILRMIEQFGQLLIGLRKMILGGGGDREEVESALQNGSQEMGFDLDLVRGFSLDSLVMLAGGGGEIQVDRAWLMAEILLLDGLQAARLGEADAARDSLTKARALYELVGPEGAMLVGIPEIAERVAEIDRTMRGV
jgi:hypothetical protein